MEFGELKDVDLRDVWPREDHDFTPWLADNLERLSQVIGIPLELEGTEVAVEQFSADILATNPRDGSRVLIENQYGWTDHDHLGKVLTYLAGLETQTIVWISQHFTEAHLSAIRWLNEHTTDPFSFFAVRVRVLQIADSPMVPVFEVLERPSDWDTQVRESARQPRERTVRLRQLRQGFWQFYAQRHPDDVHLRPNHINSNVFHQVDTDVVVSQYIAQSGVGIYLQHGRPEDCDSALGNDPDVECWLPVENVYDQDNWPQMADWLHEQLSNFLRVIRRVLAERETADD